jgi:hypothetical protein
MHTFADHTGRIWTVTIHVQAVKRCRALAGVDLYGLVDEKFEGLSKLLSDPCGLVDVLYVLCKDEADKLGVSDEDFGRSLGGDSLERASTAFLEELTDFFPDPRVRAGMRRVMMAGHQLAGRLIDLAMIKLDGIDLDAEAERLIASSGNSRASSGSTPGHSRSANSS